MILGNHDVYYRSTNKISSLKPLVKRFKNIHLCSTPFETITFGKKPIAFVHWISPEDLEECVKWLENVNSTTVCGHFEINNFEIVNNVPCIGSRFSPEFFTRFDRVFSGHFHIRSNNGLIYYVGNPFQTNWGEAEQQKGFHIYDVDEDVLTFVPNPFITYVNIILDKRFDVSQFNTDSIVDRIVRLNIPYEDRLSKKKTSAFIDKLARWAHSIEVHEDNDVTVDNETLGKLQDTTEIIRQYIGHCDIRHLDPVMLQTIVLDIHKEAMERC